MVIHEGDRTMIWKGTGARDMAGWLADATAGTATLELGGEAYGDG